MPCLSPKLDLRLPRSGLIPVSACSMLTHRLVTVWPLTDKEKERRVHGTRCRHLINCMPYRDPARRAAWMREYRKRKKRESVPASKRVPVYPVHKPVNTVPALFVPTESRDLEA